ncbi:TfoX/Sxy family protein [Nocardia sp. NBC_01377]|uniref:TfoX/Sxy family protein n=1 Tax=Nocardia sp. NBC_01377 TaxID=2903595 RepID=UPI00324F21DB
MAYDEELAERVRELVGPASGFTEKKMFGGLAFLVGGNMAVAASGKGGLMVRVDPSLGGDLLDGERVQSMVMGGREIDGWLRVSAEAVEADAALREWVERGVAYARSLPAKR